jgi:hypothetical protein
MMAQEIEKPWMVNAPLVVSGGVKQDQYEQRRQERVIGLACYGTLIDLQNFLQYTAVYSWPAGSEKIVAEMRETASKCYDAMKLLEQRLLEINDAFYAPIIPTENQHKMNGE